MSRRRPRAPSYVNAKIGRRKKKRYTNTKEAKLFKKMGCGSALAILGSKMLVLPTKSDDNLLPVSEEWDPSVPQNLGEFVAILNILDKIKDSVGKEFTAIHKQLGSVEGRANRGLYHEIKSDEWGNIKNMVNDEPSLSRKPYAIDKLGGFCLTYRGYTVLFGAWEALSYPWCPMR